MAGPHTALGDAIGLAIRTFEASDIEQRLLILLSDGTDTASRMSPVNAAEIANDKNVEIFTIGVGDPDAGGEDRVDLATLQDIATRTGGEFFFAGDEAALREVYARIDALAPARGRDAQLPPAAVARLDPAGARRADRHPDGRLPRRRLPAEGRGMTLFEVALDAFHFIRPLWLLLLPVIAGLWWTVRRARGRREAPTEGIAPHLRAALTVGASGGRRLLPIDGVALALACLSVGAAGPTWSRMPDPFVAQSAPVVVVLKVTPSMEGTDVAPSRLERGKQKIRDLLELRAGARTALIAYAGSAHGVGADDRGSERDDPVSRGPGVRGDAARRRPRRRRAGARRGPARTGGSTRRRTLRRRRARPGRRRRPRRQRGGGGGARDAAGGNPRPRPRPARHGAGGGGNARRRRHPPHRRPAERRIPPGDARERRPAVAGPRPLARMAGGAPHAPLVPPRLDHALGRRRGAGAHAARASAGPRRRHRRLVPDA